MSALLQNLPAAPELPAPEIKTSRFPLKILLLLPLLVILAFFSLATFKTNSPQGDVASLQIKPLPVADWHPRCSPCKKPKVLVMTPSRPISFVPSSTPVTWPFPLSPTQRKPDMSDDLPEWWDDGQECSIGCMPAGVILGWPIKPFHKQHPIRNGFNELRSSSFHHAIDIQVRDKKAVYAIQPGTANILVRSGSEEQVQVGNYIYWHVNLTVTQGEEITPYVTVLGYTMAGFGHLAFAEVGGTGGYLNPLRPYGTALSPWSDTATPVIGKPYVTSDGRAEVEAFDPQSYHQKTTYLTPVIAPVAVAWRLFDSNGNKVGGLNWSFRGTQNYPWSDDPLIYWPSAHSAGFSCFATHLVCKPDWQYVLAGGLTPNISLPGSGEYRLSVYAWNAGSVAAARDIWLQNIDGQIKEINR